MRTAPVARTNDDRFLGSEAWHMDTRIYETWRHDAWMHEALSLVVGRYNAVGDGTYITHSIALTKGPRHFSNYSTVYIGTSHA
jgi:hypothetical protein